jgi:two-component system, sensor histidine kinase and response regulator
MSRKKVVVIDDDKSTLDTIEKILEIYHYVVFTEQNGRHGLELIMRTQPDIVLCDVMMSGMDGYAVLAEMRKNAATATIPVLLLSARSDPNEIRHAMKLGADDYIIKPFGINDLLQSIEVRLARHQNIVEHSSQQLQQLRLNIAMLLPHEFRTPLNSIIGFGELLASQYGTLGREEALEMISTIVSSGYRLSELVENFIYLTRLEILSSNTKAIEELSSECLNGADAIIAEVALHQVVVNGHHHQLELQLSPVALRVSDAYMRKIIGELLDNACKFSIPKSVIRLTGQLRGEMYEITVSDEGRGMTAQQIASIGAYMQFDRDVHEQQGQGLGLTIVRGIAELHGGSFTVDSVLDKGTTITVRLPRVSEQNPFGAEPIA